MICVEGVPFKGNKTRPSLAHAINLSCAPAPEIRKPSSPMSSGLFSRLSRMAPASSSESSRNSPAASVLGVLPTVKNATAPGNLQNLPKSGSDDVVGEKI